jgi:hypothetical protein
MARKAGEVASVSRMKMISKKRALDKIYKRRDRYEIPDWQREEVWDIAKKQQLIDSILRGWKLPKFYLLKTADEPEEFEVVDGQQRLTAIFEFFDNVLPLSPSSARMFKGRMYKDLPSSISDGFDDFEIEYDEISDAEEEDIKTFFQRLQQGLPLTSSEKLNSVHSNLRNFCRELAKHSFFKNKVAFADKRYAFFDVAAKVAEIEIEGLDASLRFDDVRATFESQSNFSSRSAVGRRITDTLDYLDRAFPTKGRELRNRTIVQSVATVTAAIVATGRGNGREKDLHDFVVAFAAELSRQIELGLEATDEDYIKFQQSVNANVRGGVRTRHEILIRKLLRAYPGFGQVFDPTTVAASGVAGEVKRAGDALGKLIEQVNTGYAAKHGKDLFKATNKTVAALQNIQRTVKNYNGYRSFVGDLYFVFWESVGNRLDALMPNSYKDVNALRTDLEHDLDHGKGKKVAAKRKKISAAFSKYATAATPSTLAPEQFVVLQANLLSAIETDTRALLKKL